MAAERGRIPQKPALRGSQKWLQNLVAHDPGALQPAGLPRLDWVSPLAADDYAEYRDAGFLDRLGLGALAPALAEFWPRGGPVWDGLAHAGDAVVLVEAKAHVPEFLTTPSQARAPASVARIAAALGDVARALGADGRADWSRCHFQYANRLAHLWWLREQGVAAHLLFVSVLGDTARHAPRHAETWHAAFLSADYALGLPSRHALSGAIHHVFPDVSAPG